MRHHLSHLSSFWGAPYLAANYSIPYVVLALLVLFSTVGRAEIWAKKTSLISFSVACLALVCWIPIYLSLPKVEVFMSKMPFMANRDMDQSISMVLNLTWDEQQRKSGGNPNPDLQWIRQQLADQAFWKIASPRYGKTNLFSGHVRKEEDSPGNYTIRENAGKVEYVGYDIDGAEQVMLLFRTSE